jgi:hypothetical protein
MLLDARRSVECGLDGNTIEIYIRTARAVDRIGKFGSGNWHQGRAEDPRAVRRAELARLKISARTHQ